jgi:mediator of RNA polymerase II transcription subunit 12
MIESNIGYPDFYPSRPGFNQPEDVLTEDNVKNGFSAKSFVVGGVCVR